MKQLPLFFFPLTRKEYQTLSFALYQSPHDQPLLTPCSRFLYPREGALMRPLTVRQHRHHNGRMVQWKRGLACSSLRACWKMAFMLTGDVLTWWRHVWGRKVDVTGAWGRRKNSQRSWPRMGD